MAYVTVEEVCDWGKITFDSLSEGEKNKIQLAIDGVSAHLDTFYDVAATPSSDFLLAATMQSYRLYKRSNSPEGVLGSFDGLAIRVGRFDPDIQDLLSPYKKWVMG